MSQFKHDLILRSIKLINWIIISAIFSFLWFEYYSVMLQYNLFYRKGYWVMFLLFILLYFAFGRTYDAFQISLHPVIEMVYSQGLSVLMTDVIVYIITCLLARDVVTAIPMLFIFAVQMAANALWSIIAHKLYFVLFPPKKTIIIYDTREGMESLISDHGMDAKYDVSKVVSVDEFFESGIETLDSFKVAFLSGIHSKDRNVILKYCIANEISVFVIPRVGDVIMSSARQMHMFHLPVLRVDRYKPTPEFVLIKRLFDILLSGIALIVLSPVLLIVSVLIRRDGGPAFYKQVRLTKDGKEFEVIKFRSMRVDAEKDGVARLSTGDKDDRITPVGKVIRKFRIDELPQLINIFKGDMSIVGPRPERPEIAAQYEEFLPEFGLRLQAKAGLTGLAQVYGKYNTTPYDKLMMDLMYIAHPSLIEDLRICLATIKILFQPESTEGVEEGQITASINK